MRRLIQREKDSEREIWGESWDVRLRCLAGMPGQRRSIVRTTRFHFPRLALITQLAHAERRFQLEWQSGRGLSLCHRGDPALPTPQANKLPALIKGRKHRRQKGRATVREIGKWPSHLCCDGTACAWVMGNTIHLLNSCAAAFDRGSSGQLFSWF